MNGNRTQKTEIRICNGTEVRGNRTQDLQIKAI